MKSNKFLILVFFLLTLISCSKHLIEYNDVIITSEKSKEWNLPELNLTSKIPKNYKLAYNESGGFYLQARKFDNNGMLLAEISIGKIDGKLKDIHIIKALKDANKELKTQLKNIKQINYKTLFIGEELINGKKIKNLRGIIEFNEFQKTMNGRFFSFMTPVILNDNNKFMLSAMFKENENLDKNKIGIELLNFINSIKILN